MAGKTSASLSWIVVFVCFVVCVSEHVTNKIAKPGDAVVLPCRAADDINIHVEWKRENNIVCVSKNAVSIHCQNVSSSFMNRVQLSEELKFGDASLTLKNVNETDGGKYECYVQLNGGRQTMRSDGLTLLSIVNLKVEPGDTTKGANNGNAGLVAAGIKALLVVVFVFVFVVVALVVGFLICRKHMRRSLLSNNEAGETQ